MNPEEMTIEELEAAINGIGTQQRELAVEKRRLQAALSGKVLVADAERAVAKMSDDEKHILLQTLNAQGISSGENFGQI